MYLFRFSEVDEETGHSQISPNKSWETIAHIEGVISDSSFCKFFPKKKVSSSLENKCEARTFVGKNASLMFYIVKIRKEVHDRGC